MSSDRSGEDRYLVARGRVLKSWREQRSLRQQELGRLAGYGSDTSPKSAAISISRIEAGRSNPGPRMARLLEVLERTPQELEEAVASELAKPSRFDAVRAAYAGRQHVENDQRRSLLFAASERIVETLQRQQRETEVVAQRAGQIFIAPFFEAARALDGSRFVAPMDVAIDGSQIVQAIQELRASTRATIGNALSLPVGGVHPAMEAGSYLADFVYGAVQSHSTASTGRAIRELAGAAADKATLARLGFGTLANGGFGVRGGKLVLRGLNAAPLIALGVTALALHGIHMRAAASRDAEALDIAERSLYRYQDALPQVLGWSDTQIQLVSRAGDLGRSVHSRFVEPVAREALRSGVPHSPLPSAVEDALDIEIRLAALVFDVQALPVWLPFEAEGLVPASTDGLAAADEGFMGGVSLLISESLNVATTELGELEERFEALQQRTALP